MGWVFRLLFFFSRGDFFWAGLVGFTVWQVGSLFFRRRMRRRGGKRMAGGLDFGEGEEGKKGKRRQTEVE